MFRHHPDNIIYIEDQSFDLAEFVTYEPEYKLPQTAVSQEYIPGVKHVVYMQDGGVLSFAETWERGDQYIAKLDQYVKSKRDKEIAQARSRRSYRDFFTYSINRDFSVKVDR